MNAIRVVLADDHHLVRAGIRSLLETLAGVEVVAETGDGREAIELVRLHRPNLVLMDITMGGMNGLDATTHLIREFPQLRVIILSMHANEEYVRHALQAGAAAYLLKDAATAELELAVRAVAQGQTYLSPAISRQVVEEYLGGQSAPAAGPLTQLTARQREVLQLIAEGKTTKQTAALLKVSVKTIETHRAQLMERLGIHDVPGLVRYAVRHGMVHIDS